MTYNRQNVGQMTKDDTFQNIKMKCSAKSMVIKCNLMQE